MPHKRMPSRLLFVGLAAATVLHLSPVAALKFQGPGKVSPRDRNAAIVFVKWGSRSFDRAEQLVAQAAQHFNPRVPVFLLANGTNESNVECVGAGKASKSLPHLTLMNLSSFQGKDRREDAFEKNYVHCSRNPPVREKGMFLRFVWLKEWMHQTGVDHVLFADGDILFTDDVFERFSLNATSPFFALYPESSFFSYWSLEALEDFCGYIDAFYNRPQIQVFSDILEYGANKSYNVRPPVGWSFQHWPRQFSDMYILRAFLHNRPKLKQFVKYKELPKLGMSRVDESIRKIHGPYALGSCDGFDEWTYSEHVSGGKALPLRVPMIGGQRPIGLHFQDHCKSQLLPTIEKIGLACH